jgi:hypothetical protein
MPNNARPATQTTTAALLAYARSADDLEAEALLPAEQADAALAGRLLGDLDPFLTAGAMIAGASRALDQGHSAWGLLDGADRIINDLRLEYGCEDWDDADWSRREVRELDVLHCEVQAQRQRARQQRDQAAAALEAALSAQKAQVALWGPPPTKPGASGATRAAPTTRRWS